MTNSSLWQLSAHQITALVTSREVSPVEVAHSCLERLENVNGVVNAVVSQNPRFLQDAHTLAEHIAHGTAAGPLLGVPVGIKDLEDVKGLPTTFGSQPFAENIAREDSVHVARLRAAGALIVGKTNTPEFGYSGRTRNRIFGSTRNPWRLDRTPGGSSGGSAAAVAAGIVPICTGNDRAGSLRIPAAYSGCVGIKPSYGRIPSGWRDMLTWTDTESLGCITRSVQDAALFLDAAAGPHPSDPDSLPASDMLWSGTTGQLTDKLRIAWTPEFAGARCDPDVRRITEEAARRVEGIGWQVSSAEPTTLPGLLAAWTAIGSSERHAELCRIVEEHRSQLGGGFIAGVERGKDVTPAQLGDAFRVRSRLNDMLASLFDEYDLLVMPTTPTEAILLEGDLPSDIDGVAIESPLELFAYSVPFNLSGHPAISIPAGLTQGGLPVGLQIVAPRHMEDRLLQAATVYEDLIDWPSWGSPPALP